MTIARKRPEPRRDPNPGAGSYNPEACDTITRAKTPGVHMGKSPSRPSTFAKPGYDTAPAPGTYDDGKRFNSGIKPMTIGRARPVKVTTDAPGAGTYEPDRAHNLTKPNAPNYDMGRSPVRPSNFVKQSSDGAAPGQYDCGKKFMDDVKPITIGRKRPVKVGNDVPDAGSYNPSAADGQTKTKAPATVDMGRGPTRPSNFVDSNAADAAGPGQYDCGKKFMDDVKPITIGRKRPQRVGNDVPDAGSYNPSAADGLTKPKAPATVDMSRSPIRPSNFVSNDAGEAAGPGTYDSPMKFG